MIVHLRLKYVVLSNIIYSSWTWVILLYLYRMWCRSCCTCHLAVQVTIKFGNSCSFWNLGHFQILWAYNWALVASKISLWAHVTWIIYQGAALLIDTTDSNLKTFGLLFKLFIIIILSNKLNIAFEWTWQVQRRLVIHLILFVIQVFSNVFKKSIVRASSVANHLRKLKGCATKKIL